MWSVLGIAGRGHCEIRGNGSGNIRCGFVGMQVGSKSRIRKRGKRVGWVRMTEDMRLEKRYSFTIRFQDVKSIGEGSDVATLMRNSSLKDTNGRNKKFVLCFQ